MKEKFEFTTDTESAAFCEAIVDQMVSLFGITRTEALGRMNRHWKGLILTGHYDMIYHEDEDYWANMIYYGKNSGWWQNPPDLKPLPYSD